MTAGRFDVERPAARDYPKRPTSDAAETRRLAIRSVGILHQRAPRTSRSCWLKIRGCSCCGRWPALVRHDPSFIDARRAAFVGVRAPLRQTGRGVDIAATIGDDVKLVEARTGESGRGHGERWAGF